MHGLLSFIAFWGHISIDWLKKPDHIWIAVGFIGQLVFGARFYVQWIASEKAKQSVVPVLFWYLSIAGSLILMAYALYRRDPVFFLGQLPGSSIYVRNLILLKKQSKQKVIESQEIGQSVRID